MALLTAVPFGLAIRDTIRAKDQPPELEAYAEAVRELEVEDDSAEDFAEAREEAEREQRRRLEVERALGKLVGKPTATLGPAFEGVHLGMSQHALYQDESLTNGLFRLERDYKLDINLDVADGVLARIRISADDDDALLCELVNDATDRYWGEASEHGVHKTWSDAAAGQRVQLRDDGTCELTYERFAAAAGWFAKRGRSIVPVWAIGATRANLASGLSPLSIDAASDDALLSWQAAGLDDGTGMTTVGAYLVKDKVVAVTATVNGHTSTVEGLVAHLTAELGEPTEGEDGELVWSRTKPQVTLLTYDRDDDLAIHVTVGKLPD